MSEKNLQKTRPFTKADNAVLYSRYLTFGEKFLYFYVKSKPADWKFNLKKITTQTSESIGAVTSSFEGLKKLGLIARKPVNNNQFNYILYEYDEESIEVKYKKIKKCKAKPSRRNKSKTGKSEPEKTEPEKPNPRKTQYPNKTENPTNTECESEHTHSDSFDYYALAKEIELFFDPKPINSHDDLISWTNFLQKKKFNDQEIIDQVFAEIWNSKVTMSSFARTYNERKKPKKKVPNRRAPQSTSRTPEQLAEIKAALGLNKQERGQ